MKKVILFIIVLTLFQSVCAQGTTKIDWNSDLDYFAKHLSEKHYNLFSVRSRKDFKKEIHAIKEDTENLTNLQVALKIQQLIATLGDSHTSLNFTPLLNKNKTLPVGIYWASDGLYIIRTVNKNKDLLGCQLLSINEVPIATVIDSLSTLFTIDNQATLKAQIPQYLPSFQLLEYFGFVEDNQEVRLGIRTQLGEHKVHSVQSTSMTGADVVSFKPSSYPFYLKHQKEFFADFYQPQDKVYYMLYNRCWSKEIEIKYGNKDKAEKMPSFKEFEERAFQVLKKENVDKIVFDIRMNGGGNSSQGTAFIERLATYLKANPQIKMYVVIGRNTFSSAILNAMDFKRLTNAIFVGEETAGKPNHFGEVRGFQLPSSKLSVRYSTKYFIRAVEDVNTLRPNAWLETSFSDFAQGVDPVYEWIRKQ